MLRHRNTAILAVAGLVLAGVVACTPAPIVVVPTTSNSASVAPIVVGTAAAPDGSNPIEGSLLANLYAVALNAAGINAVVKAEDPNDPTLLAQLVAGTVDVAPSYGTSLLQQVDPAAPVPIPAPNASTVIGTLKEKLPQGVLMLDATKAEDNDSIVVTAVTAEKYQLKTLTDLGKVCSKLVLGGSDTYRTKPDGLASLSAAYGCIPQSYQELSSGKGELLMALLRDNVQFADIHSSSPDIEDNALVVLEDNAGVFRRNPLIPLVNSAKVPADYQAVLNKVSAQLGNDDLRNLNRLGEGASAAQLQDVAKTWLVQKGLIKNPS